ncbi:SO2930 family diheme c-type cytochrome [Mesorhizobium sp. CAU 1732]|uniref:SO2930 family diheme c-type cytochrome n=1 Tax=Mesorhizobium sp. CAU 1732 TaxID=3140358 RepID=UPI003261C3F7
MRAAYVGWRVGRVVLALTILLSSAIASPAFAVSDEAILADRPPKLLSAYGFFDDMARQRPADRVVPFSPATALFSDGALKMRFAYVPEGKAATYVEDEAFDFPVGSALVKTFAFPADFRAPDTDVRLIETRVMLKHENGWQAWAYLWNDAQTEAELKIAGAKVDIATIGADGDALSFTYAVPNKNQCKACHAMSGEIVPLGPKARNLNHVIDYDDGQANQLERWRDEGMLEGLPDLAALGAAPDWRDESAPIDARARAWLDVNCAHCHRREGPASNSGLYLTWTEPHGPALGINKRPVAAGRGSGGRLFDIKPGDPDGSILNYRVESIEPGIMMPELGRALPDDAAATLLRAWVESLK